MQKNARRTASKRHSDIEEVDSGSVSYYQWAERSMQTASHARVISPSHPGPIRRFFKRMAGKT
jgi:hypothetical protein